MYSQPKRKYYTIVMYTRWVARGPGLAEKIIKLPTRPNKIFGGQLAGKSRPVSISNIKYVLHTQVRAEAWFAIRTCSLRGGRSGQASSQGRSAAGGGRKVYEFSTSTRIEHIILVHILQLNVDECIIKRIDIVQVLFKHRQNCYFQTRAGGEGTDSMVTRSEATAATYRTRKSGHRTRTSLTV